MVIVNKTYAGVRTLGGRILSVAMVIIGFATLLFMSSHKSAGSFGNTLSLNGVAHADAVSSTSSVDCAGDCGSFDCGGPGGGACAS